MKNLHFFMIIAIVVGLS